MDPLHSLPSWAAHFSLLFSLTPLRFHHMPYQGGSFGFLAATSSLQEIAGAGLIGV